MRIVIDTNLIIASRFKSRSGSSRILEMCTEEKVEAVYSPQIKNENLFILEKVRPGSDFIHRVIRFYSRAKLVRPREKVKVCEDPDDDKYLDAALAGKADYIISNDRHLLEHDGWRGIRIVRPGKFLSELKKGGKV
ncbi:MAG: putative toxin-antitoxin system toxin component, PIN family, partial [Candidatus Aenigmatarchaeota archaeon]